MPALHLMHFALLEAIVMMRTDWINFMLIVCHKAFDGMAIHDSSMAKLVSEWTLKCQPLCPCWNECRMMHTFRCEEINNIFYALLLMLIYLFSAADRRNGIFGNDGAFEKQVGLKCDWFQKVLSSEPSQDFFSLRKVARVKGEVRVCTFGSDFIRNKIPAVWSFVFRSGSSACIVVVVLWLWWTSSRSSSLQHIVSVRTKRMH